MESDGTTPQIPEQTSFSPGLGGLRDLDIRWRARPVAPAPPGLLSLPQNNLMAAGMPIAAASGFNSVAQPLRSPWGSMVMLPMFPGAGSGGGGGSVTITQGTGISVTPNGVPDTSFTIAGAYTAGTLIDITGAVVSCLLTAGDNLSFTGNELNAADQTPTSGYGITVSGREVNWTPKIMPCLLLLNAVRDTGTDVLTTGEDPLNVSTADDWNYVYKGVPVKATALSYNSGTGAVTLTVAVDTDEAFAPAVYSNAAYVEVFNIPISANGTGFAYAGVNVSASTYPAGFSPMGIGELRDEGGGASTWRSPVVPGYRYEISSGNYVWFVCVEPDHDGSCSAPDVSYSSLPEVLTAAEF